jgi:pimeloyl-ACP methyl ester carboxylesterase
MNKLTTAVLIWLLTTITITLVSAQDGITPQDLADPDGQFIEIDGASIYYLDRGPVDGPVVLLLHGFGGSTFTWRDNIDVLAEAGFRVVAYDRPPFGLSDKNPALDYSPAAAANQALGLMNALDIETATLVGHSAGGSVIAHFAIEYADRVDGMVFVAGAVGYDRGSESVGNDSALGGLFQFAANLSPESSMARQLVRAFVSPERFIGLLRDAYYDPDIVTDEVAAGYQRILQIEGWEAAFLALLQSPADTPSPDLELLAQSATPILLIWGEEDTWVPLAVGQRLHQLLPAADWITYRDVGHLPMEEKVEQFNTDLLAFLARIYSDFAG